jgi:hypothetical protein
MIDSLLHPWRFGVFGGLSFAAFAADLSREMTSLDQDGRFRLGDVSNAIAPDHGDQEWRRVDVPHDYVVEGVFDSLMTLWLQKCHNYRTLWPWTDPLALVNVVP